MGKMTIQYLARKFGNSKYLSDILNITQIVKLFWGGGLRKVWKLINHHYSIKLGFTVPVNTCGKGLNIHHYGCIVINDYARIGENCNIQQCVNIGQNYSKENVPTIGNNVYIGPGAKIFGKVTIADGCAIGAGAIVCKSFLEPDSIIVGNPAKVVGKRTREIL